MVRVTPVIDFGPLSTDVRSWGVWESRYARAHLIAAMLAPLDPKRYARVLAALRTDVLLKLEESKDFGELSASVKLIRDDLQGKYQTQKRRASR